MRKYGLSVKAALLGNIVLPRYPFLTQRIMKITIVVSMEFAAILKERTAFLLSDFFTERGSVFKSSAINSKERSNFNNNAR